MAAPILTEISFRNDGFKAEYVNKIERLERRSDYEREFTEEECFLFDHAHQLDFELITDDGNVFACTRGQLLALVRARGGQIERTKKAD